MVESHLRSQNQCIYPLNTGPTNFTPPLSPPRPFPHFPLSFPSCQLSCLKVRRSSNRTRNVRRQSCKFAAAWGPSAYDENLPLRFGTFRTRPILHLRRSKETLGSRHILVCTVGERAGIDERATPVDAVGDDVLWIGRAIDVYARKIRHSAHDGLTWVCWRSSKK